MTRWDALKSLKRGAALVGNPLGGRGVQVPLSVGPAPHRRGRPVPVVVHKPLLEVLLLEVGHHVPGAGVVDNNLLAAGREFAVDALAPRVNNAAQELLVHRAVWPGQVLAKKKRVIDRKAKMLPNSSQYVGGVGVVLRRYGPDVGSRRVDEMPPYPGAAVSTSRASSSRLPGLLHLLVATISACDDS